MNLIIEKIINKLIESGKVDISILNNKTINIHLTDINFDFCFQINNDRIFVFDKNNNADVMISITSSALLGLLNQQTIDDLLLQDKIKVVGDAKTARLLIDILKQADIKAQIAELIPDFALNKIKEINKDIKNGDFKNKIIDKFICPKVYK